MPLNHNKGRPEKVGMTTKKSYEKEAKEKKRRTIISDNGKEREKISISRSVSQELK